MKNKLTAILALLLAAIMLAGCTGSKQTTTQSTEMALKRAAAKVKPVLMPGTTPKPRKVQYVILPCQENPDNYEEKSGLQFFEYGELDALAAEAVKRSLNTEDVTDLIPLYSYENVLNLNFISDEDKMKGKYEHIEYITVVYRRRKRDGQTRFKRTHTYRWRAEDILGLCR